MGMTESQKNKIKELAINYGIKLEDLDLKRIGIFICINPIIQENEIFLDKPNGKRVFVPADSYKLKLAELIQLLSETMDSMDSNSYIEITSTIKGVKKEKVKIYSSQIEGLYLFANTELERISDGFYQYEFNFDFKEQNDSNAYEYLKEPYTKEELDKILKYERSEYKKMFNYKRTKIKRQVNILCHYFREEGVFNNKTKELNSKEYQFLYDALAVLGIFPEENIEVFSGSMKKEALRDYVRKREK